MIKTPYDRHFSYQTSYVLGISLLVLRPIVRYMSEHQYLLGLSYPRNIFEQVIHHRHQDYPHWVFIEEYTINTSNSIQQQRYLNKI